MKKIYITLLLLVFTFGIFSFMEINKTVYATVLPTNARGTGSMVPASLFSTWINGATPATNVFVKPANGLTFNGSTAIAPNSLDINFYRWTEQMFLWLLSPIPSTGGYGSCSGFVFNSPEFYDVTSTDPSTGLRTLKKHTCISKIIVLETAKGQKYNVIDLGNAMTFDAKGTANGGKGLPFMFEKGTRKMFDVDKAPMSKAGNPLVLSNNQKVEVGAVKVSGSKVTFYDVNHKVIQKPSLIFSKRLDATTTVQRFVTTAGTLVPISIVGGTITIIVPDQGQATGDALMARNGSLVYYNSMVNDVFAVFMSMMNNGTLPPTAKFPTTAAEMTVIQNYAAAHNIPIVEPNSLAMELKTSWVETTNISNLADYIVVRATVPNYTLTSGSVWTRNGTKTVNLALVGMHIVGSVAGHPEMLWGTIEHVNNTPNPAYTYTTTAGTTASVAADTNFGAGTPWLFSSATATSFNVSHMTMGGTNNLDVIANSPFVISPSDTQRTKPFGFGTQTLGGIGVSQSNAEVISTNTDVNNNLVGADIRKKYYHVGTTWNISATNTTQVGTNLLSNSTMETYSQSSMNCFSCHSNGTDGNGVPNVPGSLSHIFNTVPLP